MQIKTDSKAAATTKNQNPRSLRVKTNKKAGGVDFQHNQTQVRSLRVRSGVKGGVHSGGIGVNHNARMLRIKTGIRAGGVEFQHNETLVRSRA